jgi:MFS family permease
MLFAPVAGHLSDRFGRRVVARVGTLATLAGFVILAVADWGLVTIAIGVGLTAAGEGVSHPALVAWIGDAAPPDRRGTTMGMLATAHDLGAAIGPVIAYGLAATVGLGVAYTLAVAVMLSAVTALSRPVEPAIASR